MSNEESTDIESPSWGPFSATRTKAVTEWPAGPAWRGKTDKPLSQARGESYRATADEEDAINAAIYLRRPLLITGQPGVGKSSLAYAAALRLGLGKPLVWPISTKSTLKEGQYAYDAIGRLQTVDDGKKDIGRYITLGALGTALHSENKYPRVVLVDEIDKSDVDLPNDLLNILEEGSFEIPELARIKMDGPVDVLDAEGTTRTIKDGKVACHRDRFPLVILTSNGEREFPAPFLRRCIRLTIKPVTDLERMKAIVSAHELEITDKSLEMIQEFITSSQGNIATDQLLNAIFLLAGSVNVPEGRRALLKQVLMKKLDS